MTSMRKLRKRSLMRQNKKAKLAKQIETSVPEFKFKRRDKWIGFGGCFPWQADGFYLGQPCYVRYRHDAASMDVYDDETQEVTILSAVIWDYLGEEQKGWLEDDEIAPCIKALILELKPPNKENLTMVDIIGAYVDAYAGNDWKKRVDEKYATG